MRQMSPRKVAIAASTFACAALLSFSWSEQRGVSLSIEAAQARVGRPLTPMSGAGVARRHYRRGAYRAGAVGAGLAGAAAVGTAAAVAATSPVWGGGPYYGEWGGVGPYYGPGAAGGPYYGPRVAGGPYYGPRVRAARAAYPVESYAASAPTSWSLHEAYYAGGPFYGYSGWEDYKARNGIACDPGSAGCQ